MEWMLKSKLEFKKQRLWKPGFSFQRSLNKLIYLLSVKRGLTLPGMIMNLILTSIQWKRIKSDTDNCLEHVCLQVKRHQACPKLSFIVVYRPPNSTSDFCRSLPKLIDYAHSWHSKIIVTGHFWILTFSRRRKATSAQSSVMLVLLKVLKTATRVNDKISALIEHIYTIHPNRIVQSFCVWDERSFSFMLCTQISWGQMSEMCTWWD